MSHAFSGTSGQIRLLISFTAPWAQSACVAANNVCALSRSLEGSRRACFLVLVLAATPQHRSLHSSRAKSAVHPHLPPIPAGILVPARVAVILSVNLGPRASSSRLPLLWAHCCFGIQAAGLRRVFAADRTASISVALPSPPRFGDDISWSWNSTGMSSP